jgi:hypothetical protein
MEFVCIFYCVLEVEGFIDYSFWKVSLLPSFDI